LAAILKTELNSRGMMTDDSTHTSVSFRDGKQAAKAGEPTSANPFPIGGDAYEMWLSGWKDEQAAKGDATPDDV
jgi:hypothetical protein